jgi:hypothetical protein
MRINLVKKFIAFLLVWIFPLLGNMEGQEVFFTILARNKEHILPAFLKSIENLDYNKKLITLYINTNNNVDGTATVLATWAKEKESLYKQIIFESHEVQNLSYGTPHEWTTDRLHALALIRNRSLALAKESNCDFYFIVDCDNFIIPSTLSDLVTKDLPIVAPMLQSIPEPGDVSSNFFSAVTDTGYYQDSPEYREILLRKKIGTFKEPLVHCTYLIKSNYLDQLSYTDGTSDYEFIIFAKMARNKKINQYICNEKNYGYNINFYKKLTLEEEKEAFSKINIEDLLKKAL